MEKIINFFETPLNPNAEITRNIFLSIIVIFSLWFVRLILLKVIWKRT